MSDTLRQNGAGKEGIFAILCGGSKPPPCLGDQKKKHKETFLIVFFSLVRKERKGQKEERIPLLNTFRRLAATGANTLPRPSNYSLTTATGSKRSSADSDLLLCHVRLWRTSRLELWCVYGCEHSTMRAYFDSSVSAGTGFTPATPLYAGVQTMRARICSASSCDMFARVVYVRLWRVQNCQLLLCYLPHALATHGLRD